MAKYVALTGAAGFIGRVVCRRLLERGDRVYAIDRYTYAADPECLQGLDREFPGQLCVIPRNILDLERWPSVDAILHLAAESHVDNSVDSPSEFIETNIIGTAHLLEMTRRKKAQGVPHFIYVSTDEIYGSLVTGKATAASPLHPSSPYAVSKAAADLMVQAWGQTYEIPYTIARPTNVYGAGQYPEKLIPTAIRSLILGRPIPMHGDGSQTRQWLWVEDVASALLFILDNHDRLGRIQNIGGNQEASVRDICLRVSELVLGPDPQKCIKADYERPCQDARYAVDDSPLREAGWVPTGDFWRDLPGIVAKEREIFRF